ncbi:Uncharacterised protein [Vibrio cholerae]|nr:Uncharacterised protein [Vibrio cholerae]CSD20891.1 Uncharacterised protein [Vibrio cholerae]
MSRHADGVKNLHCLISLYLLIIRQDINLSGLKGIKNKLVLNKYNKRFKRDSQRAAFL